MTIAELRAKIDDLDRTLLLLLADRRKLAESIIRCKVALNASVRDEVREHTLIENRVVQGVELGLDRQMVVNLFHEILADSVLLQQQIAQSETKNALK